MRSPACPVCRKPSDPAYRPFCSKRCADVDLQRWLAGIHRLSADEEDDEADQAGGRPSSDPSDEA